MKARFRCEKNHTFIFLSKLKPNNIDNTNSNEINKIVQNIINHFTFDDCARDRIKNCNLFMEIKIDKNPKSR